MLKLVLESVTEKMTKMFNFHSTFINNLYMAVNIIHLLCLADQDNIIQKLNLFFAKFQSESSKNYFMKCVQKK